MNISNYDRKDGEQIRPKFLVIIDPKKVYQNTIDLTLEDIIPKFVVYPKFKFNGKKENESPFHGEKCRGG